MINRIKHFFQQRFSRNKKMPSVNPIVTLTLNNEGNSVSGKDVFGNEFTISRTSDGKLHRYISESPVIDIHSKREFPANVLSNLYPSEFIFEGIQVKSMEGLLQSFKTSKRKLQRKIQAMDGIEAKEAGGLLNTRFDGRHIHWNGRVTDRFSDDYRQLLRQAYRAKYEQDALFRFALESTGNKQLIHSIGKQDPSETILTEKEFITLLDELRCL